MKVIDSTGQVIGVVRTRRHVVQYPGWSGRKRRLIPRRIWEAVMGSRLMNVRGLHLVLRWLLNKSDEIPVRWT